MFSIASIDHIVLRTDKLGEMLTFYCQVLGCNIERETDKQTGLTQLRAGNALIDIVTIDSKLGRMGGEAPSESGINVDHFCLQLELISEQAIEQHLNNYNIAFNGFERRYGAQGYGQSVYIQDPQGNTVELRSQINHD